MPSLLPSAGRGCGAWDGRALSVGGEERTDREILSVEPIACELFVQCHRSSPFGYDQTSGEDEQDEDYIDYDVHQPAVRVHPVAHLGHGPSGAMTEQQVRESRKRRYEDGRSDKRQGGKQRGVVLREVHPHRHQNDEVRREHRKQQKPGHERRFGLGVLHGAKPPWWLAPLAIDVAPYGKQNEQPYEHVLDNVAERSGIRRVAKGDAVSEHAGEGVSDGEAHADGYNHASEEVGREPKGLVGGDEDDGRHDLRPRVHSDGEGNYGQAHGLGSLGSRFPPALGLASSGKACTLSSSSPRPFRRSRIPWRCGWSRISPVRTVYP